MKFLKKAVAFIVLLLLALFLASAAVTVVGILAAFAVGVLFIVFLIEVTGTGAQLEKWIVDVVGAE